MISDYALWAVSVVCASLPPMSALMIRRIALRLVPSVSESWTWGASTGLFVSTVRGAWPLAAAYAVSLLLADVAGLLALESRKRVQLKDNRGQ